MLSSPSKSTLWERSIRLKSSFLFSDWDLRRRSFTQPQVSRRRLLLCESLSLCSLFSTVVYSHLTPHSTSFWSCRGLGIDGGWAACSSPSPFQSLFALDASSLPLTPLPLPLPDGFSKAAANHFFKRISEELKADGFTVVCYHPVRPLFSSISFSRS